VPVEGRDPDTVQMIEDLVIGGDLANPEAILYEPGRIVATADGTIFVADNSAVDVKVFDADGNYLKTLGQEGQGPAEFGRVSNMTIAGDRLVIFDSRNRRFSLWTLDGEHIADNAPAGGELLNTVEGLADGSVIAMANEFDPEDGVTTSLVRRSVTGENLGELLHTVQPPPGSIDRSDPRASMQMMIDTMAELRFVYTVAAGERVFVTPVNEYQVLAMSDSGTLDWALRVAWERLPYSEFAKQSFVDSMARAFQVEDEIKPSDLNWPTPYPAVSAVRTDGAGRLFVFLAIPRESEEPPELQPVDVYSPEGEFLVAGAVPNVWTYARGEHVYATRPDDNDEMEVVRYRLMVNAQ
jgi:hypothetical protein